MTNTERLRQYIAKASFASEGDRYSALECLSEIERASTSGHWPTTADDVRGFVGSDYCSLRYGREDQTPDEGDIYTMSAHDLASAIGNWRTFVLGHDG